MEEGQWVKNCLFFSWGSYHILTISLIGGKILNLMSKPNKSIGHHVFSQMSFYIILKVRDFIIKLQSLCNLKINYVTIPFHFQKHYMTL